MELDRALHLLYEVTHQDLTLCRNCKEHCDVGGCIYGQAFDTVHVEILKKGNNYDNIITAIKADIEKQKETAINPSARVFIGGEMRAIEIIKEIEENAKSD